MGFEGHPVRIRVLELLQDGPMPVRDLLTATGIEPSSLSQQLAVLRRSGIVTATREGPTVVYELAGGDVAELMRAARRILTEMLAGQNELLEELHLRGRAGHARVRRPRPPSLSARPVHVGHRRRERRAGHRGRAHARPRRDRGRTRRRGRPGQEHLDHPASVGPVLLALAIPKVISSARRREDGPMTMSSGCVRRPGRAR